VPADLNNSNGLASPLLKCINWVKAISSEGTPGQAVFWGNVRGECEWLCAEVRPVFFYLFCLVTEQWFVDLRLELELTISNNSTRN
jgi:hypothetical protein